jgi:hypothetical protein
MKYVTVIDVGRRAGGTPAIEEHRRASRCLDATTPAGSAPGRCHPRRSTGWRRWRRRSAARADATALPKLVSPNCVACSVILAGSGMQTCPMDQIALLNAGEVTAATRNGVKSGQCGWSLGTSDKATDPTAPNCRRAEASRRRYCGLSEYRGGLSAPRLCAALQALGYNHTTTLVPPPSCNGVLVAARRPFRGHGAVDMRFPEPYRMVSVDFARFRLIGIYMPNLRAKIPYWEALIARTKSMPRGGPTLRSWRCARMSLSNFAPSDIKILIITHSGRYL